MKVEPYNKYLDCVYITLNDLCAPSTGVVDKKDKSMLYFDGRMARKAILEYCIKHKMEYWSYLGLSMDKAMFLCTKPVQEEK